MIEVLIRWGCYGSHNHEHQNPSIHPLLSTIILSVFTFSWCWNPSELYVYLKPVAVCLRPCEWKYIIRMEKFFRKIYWQLSRIINYNEIFPENGEQIHPIFMTKQRKEQSIRGSASFSSRLLWVCLSQLRARTNNKWKKDKANNKHICIGELQ